MGHEELLQEAVAFARTVPRASVDALCAALAELPAQATRGQWLSVVRGIAEPNARAAADRLLRHWAAGDPSATASDLSWALSAAAAVDEQCRLEQRLELVWTGPSEADSALRRSEQVLLDLINGAGTELLLVSFVAFDIDEVVKALLAALGRGVQVTLVIETPDTSGGKMDLSAAKALGPVVAAGATAYVWPLLKRPRDSHGRYGSLHAKCCVADGTRVLISSANLTGHALNLNMEMGVLVDGGPIALGVERQFRDLMAAGTLQSSVLNADDDVGRDLQVSG